MNFNINFKCSFCGSTRIQSKEIGITSWFDVTAVGTDNKDNPTKNNTVFDFCDIPQKTTDGKISQFECGHCHMKIAINEIELFKYLQSNDMLKEI
jgi:hypothetical protein